MPTHPAWATVASRTMSFTHRGSSIPPMNRVVVGLLAAMLSLSFAPTVSGRDDQAASY